MILYIDNKGNTTHIVPEQLFQYSHLKGQLRVVGDFEDTTDFVCLFRLPSGETTPQKSMTLESFEGKNSWVLPIDASLTENYGQMRFQFRGTFENQTVATGRGIINIIRSSI